MAASGGFRIFGDLEREIMAILWRDGSGTVRSVWRQIAARRPIAYTTVMTAMAHLTEKRILACDTPRGARSHPRRFRSLVTKDELMQQAVRRMWDDLSATEAERRQLAEALHG